MAATCIMSIHINKGKNARQCIGERLDYIMNPKKTDGGILVSTYACSPETAAEEACRGRLRQRGLEMPPGYFIETYHGHFAFCQAPLRLLLSQREQPVDGLIVYDDNYLPYLNRVLRETPGAAGRLRVAANVNYPAIPPVDFPVRFFGIDMIATLENGLRFIDRARAGENPDAPALVPYMVDRPAPAAPAP